MRFIDLFCGAGGATQGFKDAGWTHVAGVEWDKNAAAVYAANHGHVIVKDVRHVTAAADFAPLLQGAPCDVLFASPPCQSFSTAAQSCRPPDERDDLYKAAVRLAVELQPRWVVMENVMGILSKRTSAGISFAHAVERDLRDIGYACQWSVLTATAFGVPQIRRRVIFIAARDPDDIVFPNQDSVLIRTRWGPGECPPHLALGSVLLPRNEVPPEFWLSPKLLKYFETRPTKYVHYAQWDKPCRTLRASYHRMYGEHALLRYEEDSAVRMLTDVEYARIQGFPAAYRWAEGGKLGRKYMQIGNAVAPPMARAIAEALMARLQG